MKGRNGFVSNSSSSSFVIRKSDITPLQGLLIRHHAEVAKWLYLDYTEYPWIVYEEPMTINGYTDMDNFDMGKFLEVIGVDPVKVEWDRDRW